MSTPTPVGGSFNVKPQSILDKIKSNILSNPVGAAFAGPIATATALSAGKAALDQNPNFQRFMGQMNTSGSLGFEGMNQAAQGRQWTQQQQDDLAASQASPGGSGPGALLSTPMWAADQAWSYGVARPASTAALVTNPERTGGLVEAWNRSADVSYGQAITGNPIFNHIPGPFTAIAALGDVDSYDPWSDASMVQAHENPYYNFVTGTQDAALQIVVPPAVKAARMGLQVAAGITNTVRTAEQIGLARADWAAHKAATLGDFTHPDPHLTTIGTLIDAAAGETRIGDLMKNPIVANSTGIDKYDLADILARTSDPDTVAEITFANIGDITALKNLANAAPDHVWQLSDMRGAIVEAANNGSPFYPQGAMLDTVKQTFDSALRRDQYFQDVHDLFVSEKGGPKMGSTWIPVRGSDGRASFITRPLAMRIEKTRNAKNAVAYAVSSGDLSDAPQWVATTLRSSPGAPAVRLMQWVGSKQPLGTVSKSGARPNEFMVEYDSMMNSVPLFRGERESIVGSDFSGGGLPEPVIWTSPEIRASHQAALIAASKDGTLETVWQGIENDLVDYIARDLGKDPVRVRKMVDGFREAQGTGGSYLGEQGFIFDDAVNQMRITPQTRRQMLNSFQTLPMETIYQMIRTDETGVLGAAGLEWGADHLTAAFDFGMKFFRTNVLFRGGYIGKNSVAEPLLAAALAHATVLTDEGVQAIIGNVAKNRINNLKRVAYLLELDTKAKNFVSKSPAHTRKELKGQLDSLISQRHMMQRDRDAHLAEWDQIMAGKTSPTYAANYADDVRGRLVEAQQRIYAIERSLDSSLPEWRQVVEPGSLADVRAALRGYKSMLDDPSTSADVRAQIESIQALYDDATAASTDFVGGGYKSSIAATQAMEEALADLDKRIGAKQVELGAKRQKLDDVSGIRGYHGSGDTTTEITIGGEKFVIDSLFSEKADLYGKAMRSEFSAGETQRLTLDPSYRAGSETARWRRTHGMYELGPDNPLYWEEKAWAANAHIRGDSLWQQLLEDKPLPEVAKWLATPEGMAYQKGMGRNYLIAKGDSLFTSTNELYEAQRLLRQYFPEPEVRRLIAEREITPSELMQMQGESENLSRISGQDLIYNPEGKEQFISKALDVIWQGMTAHIEDRLVRWPFGQREFKKQMTLRGNILAGQGVKMSSDEFQSFRRASARAALQETEKTFYNIRRYSTPVYASRFMMSFPGAFFNSLYRYGRFLAKEPERVFQANLFAADIVRHGGVDENGDPVKDLRDAKFILIPGTAGMLGQEQGLKVPLANLLAIALNAPSASWPVPVAASVWVGSNPNNEDTIRSIIGDGVYDQMFPFGVSRNPISTMFSSYQKDAYRLVKTWMGQKDADFTQTSVQILADNMATWEKSAVNGVPQGPMPTIQDAIDDTYAYYKTDLGMKWGDSFGTQHSVPGQVMRDAWNTIRAKYGVDTDGARKEFMTHYGDWARWYTFTSSDYSAYLPPTQQAYNRIFTDFPDLTKRIVDLVGDSTDVLSLMALGTSGQYNQNVYNFYRDNALPGDDVPIAQKMDPEQFQTAVKVAEGWDTYNREKAVVDATLIQLRTQRDDPNASPEQRWLARQTIDAASTVWDQHVEELKAQNQPWAFDKTESSGALPERAALTLQTILGDPKFAATVGKEPLWQAVDQFLQLRSEALATKAAIPTTGYKREDGTTALSQSDAVKVLKSTFSTQVRDTIIENNPDFAPVWDRYFAKEWEVS